MKLEQSLSGRPARLTASIIKIPLPRPPLAGSFTGMQSQHPLIQGRNWAFMSHHLGVGRVVGLLLLGALVASGSRLQAQDAGSLDRGIAPPTDRRDGDDQPRDRVDRSGLSRPEL